MVIFFRMNGSQRRQKLLFTKHVAEIMIITPVDQNCLNDCSQ